MNMRFPSTEVTRLKSVQDGSFFDRCIIHRHGPDLRDEYGDATNQRTPDSQATPCGFKPVKPSQQTSNAVTLTTVEAELRLPTETLLGIDDLIELISIHGQPVDVNESGWMFALTGTPVRGKTALVAGLKRVTSTQEDPREATQQED